MCVIYVRGKMMITDVNEWLAQTPQKIVRLEAKCADGFRMSIQASQAHYCSPRINKCQNYETVEIGFPNKPPTFFLAYAEDPGNPTGTIYGYVPVGLVNQEIVAHGGIAGERGGMNMIKQDRARRLKATYQWVKRNSTVIEGLQCKPYTMVVVMTKRSGYTFKASGVAKCGPRDVWNAERGDDIAIGRAQKALARKICAWEERHGSDVIDIPYVIAYQGAAVAVAAG